jgi:hypothetical protein
MEMKLSCLREEVMNQAACVKQRLDEMSRLHEEEANSAEASARAVIAARNEETALLEVALLSASAFDDGEFSSVFEDADVVGGAPITAAGGSSDAAPDTGGLEPGHDGPGARQDQARES